MTRTVVVGNRALAKHVLTFLIENEWNVVGAVTPDEQAAREQAGYVPFEDLAERHGLELITTTNINDAETVSRLESLDPELCVCPGWHQIIDEAILDVPDRGFVGFHASDLPRGRGGAPVNWQIIHDGAEIVLSLFYFTPGVDAGDVIHKERIPIEERDDVSTVLEKISIAACDAFASTRDGFDSNNVEATPQSITEATYRPRRQPQDGIIDWTRDASDLRNWVRAQTDPYPGAYTFIEGERLTVWTSEAITHSSYDDEPGTVVAVVKDEGIDVMTGDGVLRLKRVQFGSRPRMWADSFARRRDLSAGDSLGTHQAPSSWLYTGLRDESGGTNFSRATNLQIGEEGKIVAVVESRESKQIDVWATFGGERIHDERISCRGRKTTAVGYEATTTGTHTLRLEFFVDEKCIDQRYLKVFVTP